MQTKLTHKLGQRLALTPQLTQSLKVLAMNSMELDAYLEESVESNPMLEMEFNETPVADAAGQQHALEVAEQEQWKEQGDDRWEAMYSTAGRDDFSEREPLWQQEQSLSESLHEQIDRQPMTDDERRLAHMLIDSLDDDGYFRSDPADFVLEVADQISTDVETVDGILHRIIHQLEPVGIGARDLTECLLLQLDCNQEIDVWVKRLLLHFPDSLQMSDNELATAAGCDADTIQQARQRMRRLDPFPGHGLRGQENYYIRPEIVFRRNSNNEIEVDIPGSNWRGIRLNEQWKEHEWKGRDKEFMSQAMKEAKWLLHALDQRSETLMKVALCLASRQRAFLEFGVMGLKPLTLQDVAEDVGLHESTISRVTNGKYADTPIGIIELRRFFSAGLPTRGGGTISVYRVQQRVKALIDSEPVGRPISDQAIADRLQAEGIEIARRTVAKYREQLGLLPSSQRRRATKARHQ
ncbi:RNA polymerase factor sigma-54 [Mariprofundus erugo]|uniref:RNA polymerase sigma-54 factor n=1 Tax=Mariprofundus erugo TaxID=2528639 RepID=A0A5R9GWB9_9PROT|nr:RNA polymerase factor sigma-54 [Mariprofundus erugo]TLS68533.1 RNA polymerase factor sigma-54 [Mariprofundus erugo]TLS76891.1 RNA polymerase factor sigma-54 [Mariprofundus erugo]